MVSRCKQRGTWSEPKRALQVHLHGGATGGGFGSGYCDWDGGYFRKAPRSVGQGEGCLVEVLQWPDKTPDGVVLPEKTWNRLLSPRLWSHVPATSMVFYGGAWADSSLCDVSNTSDVGLWPEVTLVSRKTLTKVAALLLLLLQPGSFSPISGDNEALRRWFKAWTCSQWWRFQVGYQGLS